MGDGKKKKHKPPKPVDIPIAPLRDIRDALITDGAYSLDKVWEKYRLATPRWVQFQRLGLGSIPDTVQHPSGIKRDKWLKDGVGLTSDGKLTNKRQIMNRTKRRIKRKKVVETPYYQRDMKDRHAPVLGKKERIKADKKLPIISRQEFEIMYRPLEEWDLEELSRGRPRDKLGRFSGKPPAWMTRELFEGAMEKFEEQMRMQLHAEAIPAMDAIRYVIRNDDVDAKGKPVVSANVKLAAAQFVMEHLLGKPQQRIQQDISVKLQGILGSVMVNPTDPANGSGYELAHTPGETLELNGPAGDGDVIEGVWEDSSEEPLKLNPEEEFSEFYNEEGS